MRASTTADGTTMGRWFSIAAWLAVPCLLALLLYDWAAVVVFGEGPYRPGQPTGYAAVAWSHLAGGFAQDLALTTIYAVTITPRVVTVVAGYSDKTRNVSLIMLGLGLAWYEVMCAWASRQFGPPDLGVALVVLFVVPAVLAPSYVRWVKTKVEHSG
jgi:hypothetical protein